MLGVRPREHASSERHPAPRIRAAGRIDFAESIARPLARNVPLNWKGDTQGNVTFPLPFRRASSWFRGTVLTFALPSSGGSGAAILPLIPCHFHRVTLQVTSVRQRPPWIDPALAGRRPDQKPAA